MICIAITAFTPHGYSLFQQFYWFVLMYSVFIVGFKRARTKQFSIVKSCIIGALLCLASWGIQMIILYFRNFGLNSLLNDIKTYFIIFLLFSLSGIIAIIYLALKGVNDKNEETPKDYSSLSYLFQYFYLYIIITLFYTPFALSMQGNNLITIKAIFQLVFLSLVTYLLIKRANDAKIPPYLIIVALICLITLIVSCFFIANPIIIFAIELITFMHFIMIALPSKNEKTKLNV